MSNTNKVVYFNQKDEEGLIYRIKRQQPIISKTKLKNTEIETKSNSNSYKKSSKENFSDKLRPEEIKPFESKKQLESLDSKNRNLAYNPLTKENIDNDFYQRSLLEKLYKIYKIKVEYLLGEETRLELNEFYKSRLEELFETDRPKSLNYANCFKRYECDKLDLEEYNPQSKLINSHRVLIDLMMQAYRHSDFLRHSTTPYPLTVVYHSISQKFLCELMSNTLKLMREEIENVNINSDLVYIKYSD